MTCWGAKIREVRTAAGLSRPDFGLRIGEPHYLVQRWELEGKEPLAHTAVHVAQRLGLRVDDLTGPNNLPGACKFTASPRVGKHDTCWRANIEALVAVAGGRAQLARELGMPKIMVQSWIHRRSVPVLRTAARVDTRTGIALHALLTTAIDAEVGFAYARGFRAAQANSFTKRQPRHSCR